MPSQKIIARIPSSPWEPVAEVLAICTELVGNLELPNYSLTFEADGFICYPYLQLSINQEGQYLMEITSNNFLEPKMKQTQISLLESFGWHPPSSNNPNFSKTFERSYDHKSIATYSLTVFRLTFVVTTKDVMRFSSAGLNSFASLGQSFEANPSGGFRIRSGN